MLSEMLYTAVIAVLHSTLAPALRQNQPSCPSCPSWIMPALMR
jgi:hypothetical protein